MGVKADNMQVGQSVTTTQNFNIRAPLDGTLRLSRGDAGAEVSDPIKIEANNDVTLAGNLLSGVFGTGQLWQDVVATRTFGTVYTNSTGKPILVYVGCNSTVTIGITATVGGVSISGCSVVAGAFASLIVAVPAGATYSVATPAGSLSNINWKEMR